MYDTDDATHGKGGGGPMKVGFIGLGGMGLPMARHVLQAGHTVTVYNRTRARADQLKHLNAGVADSPAAAAQGAEVLITMVGDDAALEEIMLGERGALAALPKGAIHVSIDRKSTRLNSSHGYISYAVFCLKKKKHKRMILHV